MLKNLSYLRRSHYSQSLRLRFLASNLASNSISISDLTADMATIEFTRGRHEEVLALGSLELHIILACLSVSSILV